MTKQGKSLQEALRAAAAFFAEHPDKLTKSFYARDREGMEVEATSEAACSWCFVGRVAYEMGNPDDKLWKQNNERAAIVHTALDNVAIRGMKEFDSLAVVNDTSSSVRETIMYARDIADWMDAHPEKSDMWRGL